VKPYIGELPHYSVEMYDFTTFEELDKHIDKIEKELQEEPVVIDPLMGYDIKCGEKVSKKDNFFGCKLITFRYW